VRGCTKVLLHTRITCGSWLASDGASTDITSIKARYLSADHPTTASAHPPAAFLHPLADPSSLPADRRHSTDRAPDSSLAVHRDRPVTAHRCRAPEGLGRWEAL